MDLIGDLVRTVRNLRTEAGMAAAAWVPLTIAPNDPAAEAAFRSASAYLEALSRARPLEILSSGSSAERPAMLASTSAASVWLGSDPAAEAAVAARRRSQEAELRQGIERLRDLLSGDFASRAPAPVVERERARLADLESQLKALLPDR